MNFDLDLKTVKGLITLLNIKGIGSSSALNIAKNFTKASDILGADRSLLKLSGLKTNQIESIHSPTEWTRAYSSFEDTQRQAYDNKVQIVSFFEASYPQQLRMIPMPPPILFIRGSLRTDLMLVACVGTREPSPYGEEITKRLTTFLAVNGIGIVSGLALGVDTIVHETALNLNAWTCAVLANGLDSVYPAKNKRLAERILDAGGALVSEQPFGAKAMTSNLILRDRIQSGLSLAVFPMQTDIKGGTMHTIKFALEQGRGVFIPVPPAMYEHEDKNRGLLYLLNSSPEGLASLLKSKECEKAHFNIWGISGRDKYSEVLMNILKYQEKFNQSR